MFIIFRFVKPIFWINTYYIFRQKPSSYNTSHRVIYNIGYFLLSCTIPLNSLHLSYSFSFSKRLDLIKQSLLAANRSIRPVHLCALSNILIHISTRYIKNVQWPMEFFDAAQLNRGQSLSISSQTTPKTNSYCVLSLVGSKESQ